MTYGPVPPAVVAAAAEEARALLRIGAGDEAALLNGMVEAAIDVAERFVGRLLIQRTCEDVVTATTAWTALAATPVTAILGVTGLPAAGAPFVLGHDDYAVDIDADGFGWVRAIAPAAAPRFAVSYGAGLAANWDAVPRALAQGIVVLAAHLFDARESDAMPPAAVAALWRPYRLARLGQAARA